MVSSTEYFFIDRRKFKATTFRLILSIGLKDDGGVKGRSKHLNEEWSRLVKFWNFTPQIVKYKQIEIN